MPNASQELLTTVEAADRLGRNRWYVIRLVKRGELTPAAQAPGRRGAYLFDAGDIERLKAAENGGRS
ncbi:MAG: helix-turn-helix transcriptional regulator [bacterium]